MPTENGSPCEDPLHLHLSYGFKLLVGGGWYVFFITVCFPWFIIDQLFAERISASLSKNIWP